MNLSDFLWGDSSVRKEMTQCRIDSPKKSCLANGGLSENTKMLFSWIWFRQEDRRRLISKVLPREAVMEVNPRHFWN